MTVAADVRGYQRMLQRITAAFERDLRRVLGGLAGLSPEEQRDALLEAFPLLLDPYLAAQAQFAETWTEDLRSEQSGSTVRAAAAELVDPQQVEAVVRWAVGPLFGETGTVLERLLGAGQRLIASAGDAAVRAN